MLIVSASLYGEALLTARRRNRVEFPRTDTGSFVLAAVCTGAIAVRAAVDAENAGEDLAGGRLFCPGDELWRALGDDAPATLAAFGAEVDDPVGLLNDVEMVLDDKHGVAEIDMALQTVEKLSPVV